MISLGIVWLGIPKGSLMRGFRLVFGAMAMVGASFGAYACGSDDASTFDGGAGDGDGGNVDATITGDGGGLGGGHCDPACGADQFCSATYKCIPNGTCAAPADCPKGEVCDLDAGSPGTCAPGGGCGGTQISAQVVPPNLLITLDRSCSMTDKIDAGDGGKVDKWTLAIAAIDRLMKNYKGKIRFGLIMFPDAALRTAKNMDRCPMANENVALGPGNETKIGDILDAATSKTDPNYPSGPCVTNIDTAVELAATDPGIDDPTRSDFVLLVTDGKQAGCTTGGGDQGVMDAVHALYTDAGVSTFAVGFGGAADPTFLSNVAIEGGTPLPDASFPNLFYNAADDVQLNAALDQIAKKTLGCVLKLGSVPPDPSQLYVFVDGDAGVPKDTTHKNGWDYSSTDNSVTFYGGICDGLKAGTVSDVQIVYGCSGAK